jgi:hypothetical protein
LFFKKKGGGEGDSTHFSFFSLFLLQNNFKIRWPEWFRRYEEFKKNVLFFRIFPPEMRKFSSSNKPIRIVIGKMNERGNRSLPTIFDNKKRF